MVVSIISGTLFAAACAAPNAHAAAPLEFEGGLKIGFASSPNMSLPANPLGFGFGGRAGASLGNVYGGIQAVGYLGGSGTGGHATAGESFFTASYRVAVYGVELGYTVPAAMFKLRPVLGLGGATVTTAIEGGGPTSHQTHVYLEPGVTGIVPIRWFYAGVDIGYLRIGGVDGGPVSPATRATWNAVTMHGQVGFFF